MTSLAAVRYRAVSVPASVWLALLVVASATVRIVLSHGIVAPWIMVDELVYSELAKSFAAHGHFLVRDSPANGYGVVYPVLIAPAWRLFGSVPAAYEAAKIVNAVVMSLAAIPAYLLSRRLVPAGPALLSALLAVLVPSMLYTGELMTENAFYPLFLGVALALVRTLERPTRLRQIAVVASCLLAAATRVQALALFPAVALAPLLLTLGERRGRRSLRPFALLYALLAAALASALLVSLARHNSPLELLGAYRAAAHGYSAVDALRYLVFHVAELDLYLGVLPFAALVALWLAAPRSSPAVRAFAAASAALVACLVTEVAVFASQPSIARVQERNLFYVAPLALTALVALAAGGKDVSAPRRTLAAAAVVAGVLPVFLPYGRLFDGAAVSDTLAILPWWSLHDRFPQLPLGAIRWSALALSLAAAAAFLAVPRRFALVLAAGAGSYFVAVTAVAEGGRHGMRAASAAAFAAGLGNADRDWIDSAVGRDADVVFVRTGSASRYAVWENELFNRSIGAIYERGGRLPGGLPETPFARGADGVLVAGGRPVHARYALVDGSDDLEGTQVAADAGPGLRLLRVDGPLTVLSEVRGLYPGDTWSGRSVVYSRLHCGGGRLDVLLESDPQLFNGGQTVTASVGGGVVARATVEPVGRRLLVVRLHPDHTGICRARFRVARTVVPARVVPGSTDERALGVHFVRVAYRDAI